MLRIVARLSATAVAAAPRSPDIKTTSAASMATSVPPPIAKTDIGFRQRRRIVDAIADEGDRPMPRAERSQRFDLAFRQDFGDDRADPGLFGDGFGRAAIVARHHDDLESLRAQAPRPRAAPSAQSGSAITSRPASLPSIAA